MKKTVSVIVALVVLIALVVGLTTLNQRTQTTEIATASMKVFEENFNEENTEFFCNETKRVTNNGEYSEFVNYSKGYAFNIPSNTSYDFSRSPVFVDIFNDDFKLRISREWSPYDEIEEYIDHYLNRFIESSNWRTANRVSSKQSVTKYAESAESYIVERRDYVINEMDNVQEFDRYSFVIFRNNEKPFFCLTYKYNDTNKDKMDVIITEAMDSFKVFEPKGEDKFNVDYYPVIPENWTQETKDLYNKITNTTSDDLMWGVFSKNIYEEGINEIIPKLEKDLEYEFPVILAYIHFNHEFPMEFMQKNWENGKIVELTYQMTDSNNEDLFGYTPNMDIYRGLKDEEIRQLAKDAKAFGHPFLFRINNEMNSDWTSYSGVINMKDPDIYVSNWQRFYRIFEEEGVNNVIWVFNPNDRNYPPCDWNNYLAYYPGNEYVHMIGVTGYNTGTYYLEEMGETWREFEEIYDAVQNEYEPFFSKFPWIITEFSSSSVGGDKAKWIDNMFNCIDKYKNIKIAVWFNFADFDYREEKNTVVSRPYWLDETPETLNAFKNGLKK